MTRDFLQETIHQKHELASNFPYYSFLCAISVVVTEDLINFRAMFTLEIRNEYVFILDFTLKVVFQDKSLCN